MITSSLPVHGGLVDIAAKMSGTPDRQRRVATYEPVADGLAVCPECHVFRNRQSNLVAVADDDPAETRRYDCAVCGQQFRVGV